LNKAKKLVGGNSPHEPPKPQYYQVFCAEGHVIRGERTEGYQALRCPHCGDGIFVLPRSPLPLPPTPATSKSKARPSRVAVPEYDDQPIEYADAPVQEELEEIQWVDAEQDIEIEAEPVEEANEIPAPPPARKPAKASPAKPHAPVEIPYDPEISIP